MKRFLLSCAVLLLAVLVRAETDKITALRAKAEAGNAVAQCTLGLFYSLGEGLPKDATVAAKWFRLAAEQGNAHAQCALGLLCANGDGVSKDAAEAVKWYRLAAEQGNARAQINLGVLYLTGEGVPKDVVEAYAWFQVATAVSGTAEARVRFLDLGKVMTKDQIDKADKRARELFEKYGKKK